MQSALLIYLKSCPDLLLRNGVVLSNERVPCSQDTISDCTNERNINFSVERAHCTVSSFPAKNDTVNLSAENLSSLVRSATETIQKRPTLTLAEHLQSNFTIQGELIQSLISKAMLCG